MASSSSSSSASSPMGSYKYDVFLSFRGDDTRKNFVSHLHKALLNRGISTFKDDRKLEMGDCISSNLCDAIRTSKFAVVVISKNYATSGWCLDELQLIMELEEEKQIKVIPIFYGVNPSDLRYQQDDFNLERYLNSGKADKVPKWKEALTLIAGRNGSDSRQCEDEATMTEDIVRCISSRLLSVVPTDHGDVFGMEDHTRHLRPLLDMDSKNDKAGIIGIWGMGGIGKTTIAKYLYKELKDQFSTQHYFMEDIRKTSNLVHLQDLLLSNILGDTDAKLWSVEHGAHYIKSRFANLKVFVVLDDVDDMKQLNALAENATWFGSGSRIIITTRDKSLLYYSRINILYNVKCLNNDDALKLFRHIAFKGWEGHPPSRVYEDLSSRVSRLAQGLPLALEAFGNYLRGKSLVEWEDALQSFEIAPYENIMTVLRSSYDSLDELGKTTFLHVACLFNGNPYWRVMNLLNRGEVGIKGLVDKSLININEDGHIAMHTFVEQMGRKIVRQESRNRPAKQRILWHHKDVYPVLADKTGTTRVEGVAVDASAMPYGFHIEWNVFKSMHNLIFLNVYKQIKDLNSKIRGGAENLLAPRELRLLHWDAYPYTTLPCSIRQDCLVELNLCNSKLKTLWIETSRLLHLRKLDLSGSKSLRELPDLDGAACLEELILEGCSSLTRLPDSIYSLSRLKIFDFYNCDGLSNIMILIHGSVMHPNDPWAGLLVNISRNWIESRYNVFTDLSIKGNLTVWFSFLHGNAEHFCIVSENQTNDEHRILEKKASLEIMRFHYNKKSDPFGCYNFSYIPWLRELILVNLNIYNIPDDIGRMKVLEKLDLSGNDFSLLPRTMTQLPKLKHVTLCNCRRLEELPELYQVETLRLSDCTNLRSLKGLGSSLLELWLDNCNHAEPLSCEVPHFTNLTYLDLSRRNFVTLPASINYLTSLVTLCLNYCKNLIELTELPLSLKSLYAHGCNCLETPSPPIEHSYRLDLSPCSQWKQDFSELTRFPAGIRSEEVPICACFKNTKMLNTYIQEKRSPISTFLHRLKPW